MTRPFVYRWRDLVAANHELTVGEKAVGWRASDYGNTRGTDIRPTHVRLARDCGFTVHDGATKHDVVSRALRRLVALGFLAEVASGHRGRAAEYRLSIPEERATPESPYSGERATPESLKGDSRVAPPTHHQQIASPPAADHHPSESTRSVS